MKDPVVDVTFPHRWKAEILPSRPLILPQHHFVYPLYAEEVERGALEVLIRPSSPGHAANRVDGLKGHDFSRANNDQQSAGASAPEGSLPAHTTERSPSAQEFLATCALGFRDPAVPTGLWSAPDPDEICAVAGGYAYLIDTAHPTRFTMIVFRPVLEVRPLLEQGLLLFVGHHALLAWGADGRAWQSEKLSDEGLTITGVRDGKLHGQGWNMLTDKETPFTLDLITGLPR